MESGTQLPDLHAVTSWNYQGDSMYLGWQSHACLVLSGFSFIELDFNSLPFGPSGPIVMFSFKMKPENLTSPPEMLISITESEDPAPFDILTDYCDCKMIGGGIKNQSFSSSALLDQSDWIEITCQLESHYWSRKISEINDPENGRLLLGIQLQDEAEKILLDDLCIDWFELGILDPGLGICKEPWYSSCLGP